jgi:hypothetical protein
MTVYPEHSTPQVCAVPKGFNVPFGLYYLDSAHKHIPRLSENNLDSKLFYMLCNVVTLAASSQLRRGQNQDFTV